MDIELAEPRPLLVEERLTLLAPGGSIALRLAGIARDDGHTSGWSSEVPDEGEGVRG